jgi:hypothetical protein
MRGVIAGSLMTVYLRPRLALRDSHPRIDGKLLAVVAQRTRGR